MPRYRCVGTVTGSKYLGVVEAPDPESAKAKALDLEGHVSFCHQCSDECEDAEVTDVSVELVEDDDA